ncbi:hypothetical protein F4805DRAFT_113805 [Annulohypoxylon moriforme]|nr:hypothetical protein F4805DRAFT_113805 [Annulohypoxylon moriforme]
MANTVASQSMELVTRSIDLLTALGNTANSPDSIVRTGLEIGRWLGRERLNERELQFCLQQAQGLVIPNENCIPFCQAVLANSPPKHVALFVVQSSGSLGRLMVNDPHLRWLTSTVAGLFQFHSEQFISDTICTFIFQARRPETKEPLSKRQLNFNADRVKMQPVLNKIISSIWFYIVNSGTIKYGIDDLLPLPEVLEKACTKGHHLQSHELGTVMAQLQRCEREVLIESEHLIKNLTSWLLYHFTGHIRVVVEANIIYSQNTGESNDDRRIEIRARKNCPLDGGCTAGMDSTTHELNIYTLVAGNLQSLLRLDYIDNSKMSETEPRVRSKLYHTSINYPSSIAGRGSIKNLTRCVAVQIVAFLLKLPILKVLELQDIVFEVNPKQTDLPPGKNTRLANLFTRLPSIMNLGWPEYPISKFIYADPISDDLDDNISIDSEKDLDDAPQGAFIGGTGGLDEPMLKTVLEHYPVLRDALREVKKSCYCYPCRNNTYNPAREHIIYRGCLQHKALMEIMQLIAHAIADGFGCDDISAVSNMELEDPGVLQVLGTITEGQLRWNDWFTVAARVYLGCPRLTRMKPGRSNMLDQMPMVKDLPLTYSPTVIAVQYGGLAVVAPWLDMSINMCQCKPFAMEAVIGRIGVTKEDIRQSRMQSVEGDFAVIEARDAEIFDRAPVPMTEGAKAPIDVTVQRDDTHIDIDVVLVNSAPSRYQLWLRVSTQSQSRLIDPSSAIRGACRLDTRVKCTHTTVEELNDQTVRGLVRTHNYNDVLNLWDEGIGPGEVSLHDIPVTTVSPFCDSYYKFNIVLSFGSRLPLIMSPETACLPCIMRQAQRYQNAERPEVFSSGFVIVVSNDIDYIDRSIHCRRVPSSRAVTASL